MWHRIEGAIRDLQRPPENGEARGPVWVRGLNRSRGALGQRPIKWCGEVVADGAGSPFVAWRVAAAAKPGSSSMSGSG